MPSSSAWVWKAVVGSPLAVSTLSSSASSFSIPDANRGVKRTNRLARCSLNGESAPRLPHRVHSSDRAEFASAADEPVRVEVNKGQKWLAMFSFVGDERFAPLSRRPRFRLRAKPVRRRPLWARIFFASKKVRSIILLNVLTVIYASDIPVLKEVEAIMEPASFNMVRFVVSAIPFLPFILQERRDSHTRSTGIELGFWVSCGYLSQALGLLTSEAGHASFISAFTVIVVPLVDGMLGAAVPALIWSGAIVSLIGVGFLECGGSPPCAGDILNILSAVFFGIHMLRTEHISRTTEKEKIMALLGYEVFTVALSSVIWFLLKDIFGNVHYLNLGTWTWSMMWDWINSFPWIPALYTGVFSTGLCLWAEMNAMNNVSATETAIIYGLEPVWGAAFAWFLLGERWGKNEWIGATLVLCSSLAVQILGSISDKSKDEIRKNYFHLNAPGKQNDLSFSTVVVNQRKNVSDLIRKQDEL
ncbi:uncharacterized protein LOC135652505 isoform X1 [Musa acuminata AAA Group]|uniref:(wild Malaysian banana) hypothetical protein n=1 Tax=Musa acuminata subsp. malaccensis TaxID=214687 RepID=A0A804L6V8_MUSAM|nr:PREDICTED: uncharacterized protein LOC103971356 [Musa acuminata subsp. malaccensis]CAG1864314.1 unnamed protein product [Musa acuminata subsp. malaccensis]